MLRNAFSPGLEGGCGDRVKLSTFPGRLWGRLLRLFLRGKGLLPVVRLCTSPCSPGCFTAGHGPGTFLRPGRPLWEIHLLNVHVLQERAVGLQDGQPLLFLLLLLIVAASALPAFRLFNSDDLRWGQKQPNVEDKMCFSPNYPALSCLERWSAG